MATPPPPTEAVPRVARFFGPVRKIFFLTMAALLVFCLIFSWVTRDAMEELSFLRASNQRGSGQASLGAGGEKTIVDVSPWETAQALAPLARTQEEADFALDAEKLADHEVDQAFASALRQATARVQKRALTGNALDLSQKVSALAQLVKQDQAQVASLTAAGGTVAGGAVVAGSAAGAAGSPAQTADSDDLEIAKAQLGLDSDQLADLQKELARASGDDRGQIQDELSDRQEAMKKFDSEPHSKGQRAVAAAGTYGTLATRISAWNSQRSRYKLIEQALQEALADASSLTAEHNTLEAEVTANANAFATASGSQPEDHAARLANLKQRSAERQLLSIYDDRIQTQQQLAAVYEKWAAQVLLQHRIMLHLIVQSLALIAFLVISILVCDALLVRAMTRPVVASPMHDGPASAGAAAAGARRGLPRLALPSLALSSLDRRRMQTLRTILQLGVQVVGAVLVLLVIFGAPRQMTTILGLTTAGLTLVLQDFIIAFFGWFVLMGKHGIRVGDWVEINSVGGEVTEIGLFRTTLLETGNWTDKGHPTGRRVTFINSFAIRGQYFNFSTAGQWMWDEISVNVTAVEDPYGMVERIRKAVLEETEQDVRVAEQEWKRGTRQDGLSQFSATPSVNLRPSDSGIDLLVRYVTRASERFEARNRIYQRVMELLQKPAAAPEAKVANPD